MSFLEAIGIVGPLMEDIVVAVGEAVANAIEHAYASAAPGEILLSARAAEDGTIVVDVVDRGTFKEREKVLGRGFGLHIAGSIARTLTIDTSSGTCVHMVFDAAYENRGGRLRA
jgi:anti-sigma regulatory factor (Ser/Thr protein kinase)